MTQIHKLKCEAPYFDAIERGDKTFEVRKDDRGFQKGDILELSKVNKDGYYIFRSGTGGETILRREISYILTGGQFGVEPGFVVMALKDMEP